jgi:hypothetical protein
MSRLDLKDSRGHGFSPVLNDAWMTTAGHSVATGSVVGRPAPGRAIVKTIEAFLALDATGALASRVSTPFPALLPLAALDVT